MKKQNQFFFRGLHISSLSLNTTMSVFLSTFKKLYTPTLLETKVVGLSIPLYLLRHTPVWIQKCVCLLNLKMDALCVACHKSGFRRGSRKRPWP